jgi:hypothetical protein
MRRQHHGGSVRTLNVKHYRLLVHRPGQPVQVHTDASMKVLRPILTAAVAAGATVEKQRHAGFAVYETVQVYEPETATAAPGVRV